MKNLLMCGVLVLVSVMTSAVMAGDGDAANAKEVMKELSKELADASKAAGKLKGEARKKNKDDQALKDFDVKRKELETAYDARLKELSPEYSAAAAKVDELREKIMKTKKELMEQNKKGDGKKKPGKKDADGEVAE